MERRLLVEAEGSVIQPVERSLERDERGAFLVTGDGAVFDSQIEVGVRIDSLAVDGEPRVGDLLAGAGFDVLNLLFIPLAKFPNDRFNLSREGEERVIGLPDRFGSAFEQDLAKRGVLKL